MEVLPTTLWTFLLVLQNYTSPFCTQLLMGNKPIDKANSHLQVITSLGYGWILLLSTLQYIWSWNLTDGTKKKLKPAGELIQLIGRSSHSGALHPLREGPSSFTIIMCTMKFFLNGAEFSLNSVNSGNLINHWSTNCGHFKDPAC